MTVEEARADLMLAQADVFYRPKDDSIDIAIMAFQDIAKISEALVSIMEHECCLYGFEDEYELAMKWQRNSENGR